MKVYNLVRHFIPYQELLDDVCRELEIEPREKILENGGTVGIFPEGKRKKQVEEKRGGRSGISFLALKTQSKILPVLFEDALDLKLSDVFKRKEITIMIGKPFLCPHNQIMK